MFKRNKRTKATHVGSFDQLQDLAEVGRPILVDFFQFGCAPCKVMDGIVDEIAEEMPEASVVKINVGKAPWAVAEFKIRSTPTFMVLAPPNEQAAAKGVLRSRWRASGLVKKDALKDQLAKHVVRSP